MAKEKSEKQKDENTEAKIKSAARKVFHQKGFAATRTRDIAEEAGINIALLNYYFRSKQNLFDIIMLETFQTFMRSMMKLFSDETSTLYQKIETVASAYIDLLLVEPQIPIFLMNEIRQNPEGLLKKIDGKTMIMESAFAKQYQEAIAKGEIEPNHMLHFVMNLMGMMVFPFIARPMLERMGKLNSDQYSELMQERKKMIPIWMNAMLKAR